MQAETGLRISVSVLGILAFILCACMSAGNAWVVSCLSAADTHSGLWSSCSADKCYNIDTPAAYLIAVRSLTVMCTIFCGVGAMFSVCVLIQHLLEDRAIFHRCKVLDLIQFLLYVASVIYGLCGLIVYYSKEDFTPNNFHYGWAFNIGWVGILFALLAFIVALLLFLHEEKMSTTDEDIEGTDSMSSATPLYVKEYPHDDVTATSSFHREKDKDERKDSAEPEKHPKNEIRDNDLPKEDDVTVFVQDIEDDAD